MRMRFIKIQFEYFQKPFQWFKKDLRESKYENYIFKREIANAYCIPPYVSIYHHLHWLSSFVHETIKLLYIVRRRRRDSNKRKRIQLNQSDDSVRWKLF